MKLILASHNRGKLAELAAIIEPAVAGIELLGYDGPEPVEDGTSYQQNALIKARAAFAHTGQFAIADDSGLAVEILGGSPGIFSAIWSGTRDNVVNRRLLLAQLADIAEPHRGASFICTIALVGPATEICFTGVWPGSIATEERGEFGHGYDPVFIPDGFALTAAEIAPEVKNAHSHRAQALGGLIDYLNGRQIS